MAIFPNMVGTISRVAITIPANTGTGSTLLALMRAAGYGGPDSCAVKILGVVPAGTNRGAFVAASPRPGAAIAASDFTTHGQAVAAGADYAEASDGDAAQTYVRAAGASAEAAVVVVAW